MSAIVLVTALRMETRAVLAALATPRRVRPASLPTWIGTVATREVVVVQGGVGRDAAHAALAALPSAGTRLLGSIGFVGALDPALVPGDLVVPATLVWDDGGHAHRYDVPVRLIDALSTALAPLGSRVAMRGTLFSSPAIVAGVAAKRAALERYDAVAVEMEAAALARHAAANAVPFFALRVVLDPADLSLEELPPNLDVSWAARARLATTPSVWPLIGALRRHAATASAALTAALRAALPILAAQ